MNHNHFISKISALAIFAFILSSCNDGVDVSHTVDEDSYQVIKRTTAFLKDAKTNTPAAILEFYRQDALFASVKMELSKTTATAVEGTVSFDEAYLEEYNADRGTEYELYPSSLVALSDGGAISISANSTVSSQVDMTVALDTAMEAGVTYAIPLSLSVDAPEISLDEASSHCVYLVKDFRTVPDCFKGEDLPKGFVFLETGECNPLNVLSYQLENGKYLWDVAVIFSANINMDRTEGRPALRPNQSTQNLLDNYELYIKPLQDRGIKVVLGLLGNRDESGLGQLSDEGAKDFAAEVALAIEAYNLDGVCLDDEYSNPPDLSNPALASPSMDRAARLIYELRQAMPDKLVTVFEWGEFYVGYMDDVVVDGQTFVPDSLVDVAVANYPTGTATIQPRSKGTYISMEFARSLGGNLTASTASQMLSGDYGWFMGFAMAPTRFVTSFSRMAGGPEVLYGSPLAAPTVFYAKGDPTPRVYPDDYSTVYPGVARN